MARTPIIPCQRLESTKTAITNYTEALKKQAPQIGEHGLSEEEFWRSGLFQGAIEKLRGTQAATTQKKQKFVADILDHMTAQGAIRDWKFSGAGERHDYEVGMPDDRICIIETKGCLDGNNTNIFERPSNADEFIIWSLCQNPGSDPDHNAWSGIHTRLSAEIIHRRQQIDGVIIWDMLCNTIERPCPKLKSDPNRVTELGVRSVPPPCIYLLPRTIPDPRNNPSPPCHDLSEVSFLHALHREFAGNVKDIVSVSISSRMNGPDMARKTTYTRSGVKFAESQWRKIRRSR